MTDQSREDEKENRKTTLSNGFSVGPSIRSYPDGIFDVAVFGGSVTAVLAFSGGHQSSGGRFTAKEDNNSGLRHELNHHLVVI